jgi:hypothetical protein
MDWPSPSYTFGHEERPQDPPPVRLTKNSIPKNPVGKTGVEKRARTPSGFTHTPTLLMIVFGLASTVKGAFGDDDSFGVVTKMAFILDASPPFALALPSGPPCISLFALILPDAVE